jgi:hypothetical protein
LIGLENIDEDSISDLHINGNWNLFKCHVQSVCDYLAAPNGIVEIISNAPGCNSPEEVLDACAALGTDNLEVQNECLVFPNPVSDKLMINCSDIADHIELIEIYNTFGAKVAAHRVNQTDTEITLDVKALPPGLYFLRLKAGNEVRTGKVIKQ